MMSSQTSSMSSSISGSGRNPEVGALHQTHGIVIAQRHEGLDIHEVE